MRPQEIGHLQQFQNIDFQHGSLSLIVIKSSNDVSIYAGMFKLEALLVFTKRVSGNSKADVQNRDSGKLKMDSRKLKQLQQTTQQY